MSACPKLSFDIFTLSELLILYENKDFNHVYVRTIGQVIKKKIPIIHIEMILINSFKKFLILYTKSPLLRGFHNPYTSFLVQRRTRPNNGFFVSYDLQPYFRVF